MSWAAAAVLALAWALAPQAELHAQGLAVSPRRVIFEGRKRTEAITLINRSSKAETYRIRFQQARMKEDGTLEDLEAPEPDGMYVDRLVRYSPRQITVPPNGAQTVRMMVRKPRDLPEGEYRSHLKFTSLPSRDTGTDIETPELKPGEIFVRTIRTFSISIPIIVRHGHLSATISMSGFRLEPGEKPEDPPRLVFHLYREGNRSIYGDITVTHVPEQGEPREVGRLRSVPVYTSVPSRLVRLPLTPPEDVELDSGRLEIDYQQSAFDRRDEGVVAKGKLALP